WRPWGSTSSTRQPDSALKVDRRLPTKEAGPCGPAPREEGVSASAGLYGPGVTCTGPWLDGSVGSVSTVGGVVVVGSFGLRLLLLSPLLPLPLPLLDLSLPLAAPLPLPFPCWRALLATAWPCWFANVLTQPPMPC